MSKLKFRPFDEQDWFSFSGCEGDPQICDTTGVLDGVTCDLTIVTDDNGINLDFYPKGEGATDVIHDFHLDTNSKTVKGMLDFLNFSAATRQSLEAMGFTYVKA